MSGLQVVGLGKAFKQYSSGINRFFSNLGIVADNAEEVWVLRGVDFSVHAGESIGIVGRNGAGKSTLLKILAGAVGASEGRVSINGTLSAVLELGTGFNPELTGRQNAAHVIASMALGPAEAQDAMSRVEHFAEVGKYFDRPLRTYSSGMQMRVAFSVALVRNPDILLVDEALSVGDAYFQQKCFARIRELRDAGTALIFVSHDKAAVLSICDKVLVIEGGAIVFAGDPEPAMDFYNALIAADSSADIVQVESGSRLQTISGTGEALVVSIQLEDEGGEALSVVTVGQRVRLRVGVEVSESLPALVFGFGIRNRLGQVMYGSNTALTNQRIAPVMQGECLEFTATLSANLGPGIYAIQVALTGTENHIENNYHWIDVAKTFEVVDGLNSLFEGSNWLDAKFGVTRQ